MMEEEGLRALVDEGMTIRQLAMALGATTSTVQRRLARCGLRTAASVAVAELRAARAAGRKEVIRSCPRHGETEFGLEGRGYYRCRRCRSERVSQRRRDVKAILVEEAGGRCVICGYDGYVGPLEFHHLDPAAKRMAVSRDGVTLSLQAAREEARKCALLCSNCHAEVEGGVAAVPARVAPRSDESDAGAGSDSKTRVEGPIHLNPG